MKTSLPLILTLTASTALAEVPQVVTDIAPIHGLAAKVMDGLGAPDLLVPPASSPHDFALRPSQARALQSADLVIWTGEGLTPWLERTLDSLSDAEILELNALDDTRLLGWRALEDFAEDHDDHGHDDHDDHDDDDHDDHNHDDHDDHDHDDHDDHGHDDHDDHDHGHDDHDEEAEDHAGHDHGHDHGTEDPHTWLDPDNARLWTDIIAARLVELDPDNAETYLANAEAAKSTIDATVEEVATRLAPHHDTPFLVFHDAYQYFETRFGLNAAGSVSDSDAAAPGPSRIRDLKNRIADEGIVCLFAEPQFESGLIDTLAEGADARIAVIDPLGTELTPGADFYPALLMSMADAFATCFDGN